MIMKCLQKEAKQRFASVDELWAALARDARPQREVSIWSSFVGDFRRSMREIRRDVERVAQPAWEKARAKWRQRRGRMRMPRWQQVSAGALACTAVFCTTTVIVVKHQRASSSANQVFAATRATSWQHDSATEKALPAEAVRQSVSLVNSFSAIDLNADPKDAAAQTAAAPAAEAPAATAVQAHPATQPAKQTKAKAQPAEGMTTPLTQREAKSAASPDTPEQAPLEATAGPTTTQETSADASNQAGSAFPAASANVTAEAFASAPGGASGGVAPATHFLEVGTFKDATWADQAVEKLGQLGFHAVSVHKGKLWMQAYHVQVGPYADAKEMEAARQELSRQGFKPQVK